MHGHAINPDHWKDRLGVLSKVFLWSLIPLVVVSLGYAYSGSIALLAETIHETGDVFAVCIPIVSILLQRHWNSKSVAIESWGTWLQVFLLLLMTSYTGLEALHRLQHPVAIPGWLLMCAAAISIFPNWFAHRLLEKAPGSHKTHSHKALDLHLLSDVGQNVGIIIAGFLIFLTGKSWIDPIASLIVSAWILKSIYTIVRGMVSHPDHDHTHHHGHTH